MLRRLLRPQIGQAVELKVGVFGRHQRRKVRGRVLEVGAEAVVVEVAGNVERIPGHGRAGCAEGARMTAGVGVLGELTDEIAAERERSRREELERARWRLAVKAIDDVLEELEQLHLHERSLRLKELDALVARLAERIGEAAPVAARYATETVGLHGALLDWQDALLDRAHPGRPALRALDDEPLPLQDGEEAPADRQTVGPKPDPGAAKTPVPTAGCAHPEANGAGGAAEPPGLVPLGVVLASGAEGQEPAPGFLAWSGGHWCRVTAVLERTAVVAESADRAAPRRLCRHDQLAVDPERLEWRPRPPAPRRWRAWQSSTSPAQARLKSERRARQDQARRSPKRSVPEGAAPAPAGPPSALRGQPSIAPNRVGFSRQAPALGPPLREPSIETALGRLAVAGGYTFDDLRGPGRRRELVRVRREAAAHLRGRGLSLAAIGRWLNRDGSSVHHLLATRGAGHPGEKQRSPNGSQIRWAGAGELAIPLPQLELLLERNESLRGERESLAGYARSLEDELEAHRAGEARLAALIRRERERGGKR